MSNQIRARIIEVRPSGDNMDVVVEYVDAKGKVLDSGTHTLANTEAAMAAFKSEVIKPRLQALRSQAHMLVGDLVVIDADTGEEVETEPGIPAERAAQYAAIFAEYAKTGATEAPEDYATALAVVEAWIDAGETDSERLNRMKTALKLATLRAAMIESGCTWSEALAWYAAQQQ